MFDIGGWEFLVIVVIAIIVIGPKDLPATIRTVGGWVRKARELAREFQSGLDDLARETELDNVRNDIQSNLGLDEVKNAGNSIRSEIEHAVDPDDDIKRSFDRYDEDDFGGERDLDDDYEPPDEEPAETEKPKEPAGEAAPEPADTPPANAAEKA